MVPHHRQIPHVFVFAPGQVTQASGQSQAAPMLVAPQHACIDPNNLHLVGKCDFSYVVTRVQDEPHYRVMATESIVRGGATAALAGDCTDNGKAATGPNATYYPNAGFGRR